MESTNMTIATRNSHKGRIPELDIIKFFGILLVVFGHVTRMYTPVGLITPLESSSVLAITTSIIYSFHMPLFVFVSGMTFGVTCKKKSYQDFTSFASNKAKRLMIPYFVFALFWVLPFMVGFGFRPFLPYLTKGLLLSLDSRHLWYVWMLFNVFLLFWGLRFLFEKLHIPDWAILLVSASLFLLRTKYSVCPYFEINNALTYQFWFTIGYFAIQYKSTFRTCLPIIVVMGLVGNYCVGGGKTVYALTGIYVFYRSAPWLKAITTTRLFDLINKNSFGIYLFHPIIIYLLFYIFGDLPVNPYLLTALVFLTSTAASILLTELVRRKNMGVIIGEKPIA